MYLSKSKLLVAFFFLVISSVLFYGCQKDFNPENDGIIPPVLTSTSVEGRVTDETGLPVTDALVKAGLNSTKTDKNGMFKFSNATFSTQENFVTVTKTGFFEGSRTFFSRENSNNFVRIQLLKKSISRIAASSGGVVDVRGNGGSIDFEPNSFVTASGANYTGTVLVASRYLNPTNPDINDQMPGDLRGTSTAGANVGLKSFGMLAVELTDESGQKLQIKTGNKATLTVNIPDAISATAPSTIPLWFFDNATGLWKQEGSATKTGDSYIGDVTHFTFWNCDDPYEYVKIKAKVVNTAGQPVAMAKVKISSAVSGSAYDYTDNNGFVDGYVPKNQTLTIQILNRCNAPAYTGNIGPFSVQTDIGSITLNQNTTTIYGTAVNCTSTPVTDGYVQITLPNGITEFAGISNGSFSSTFINCGANNTAQLLAVDNIAQKQGSNVSINITSSNINAGALTACGVSSATFFNLTINGTTISANTSDYSRHAWRDTTYIDSGKCYYYYAAYDTSLNKYIAAFLNLPVNQLFNVPSSFSIEGMTYAGINGNSEDVSMTPLNNATQTLAFTEYGFLGQFVSGNFSGQVRRERYSPGGGGPNGGNYIVDTVNAVMSFRVRHVSPPF
jgi:hypothetical protein